MWGHLCAHFLGNEIVWKSKRLILLWNALFNKFVKIVQRCAFGASWTLSSSDSDYTMLLLSLCLLNNVIIYYVVHLIYINFARKRLDINQVNDSRLQQRRIWSSYLSQSPFHQTPRSSSRSPYTHLLCSCLGLLPGLASFVCQGNLYHSHLRLLATCPWICHVDHRCWSFARLPLHTHSLFFFKKINLNVEKLRLTN